MSARKARRTSTAATATARSCCHLTAVCANSRNDTSDLKAVTLHGMARRNSNTAIGLRLELEGQVTLQRLGEALDAWTDLLQEVGRDVAGASSRDAVRFVITEAKGGSLTLGVRPQPGRKSVPVAVMPRIAKTLTSGIRSLETRATRPKHFSDIALVKLRDLARLTSPETPSVKVGNGTGAGITLSSRLVAHVEAVLAPELESIGTVEGHLEGLITHGKNRFLIFDPITGRQVICFFSGRIDRQDVLKAYGRRVAASGVIRSRRSGEKVSISANRLYVLPSDDELPSVADVLGILKAR